MDNKNEKRGRMLILSVILTLLPGLAAPMISGMLPEGLCGMKNTFITISVTGSLIMAALDWFCLWLTDKDRGNDEQSDKVMRLVYFITPFVSLFAFAISLMAMHGIEDSMDTLVAFLIGIMFVFIGNTMPKMRRNGTMGVKLPWTLSNDENWMLTHRLTGKLWVVGGFILALSALIPNLTVKIWTFVSVLMVMCVVPVIASWSIHRKQVKKGTCRVDEKHGMALGKHGLAFSVIMIVIVVAFVLVMLFAGKIEYRFYDESFTADPNLYGGIEIRYDAIDTVELVEGQPGGNRVFGYGSPRMDCGTFRSAELGKYTRYTVPGSDCYVLITMEGEKTVFAAKTTAETEAIYSTLLERTGK